MNNTTMINANTAIETAESVVMNAIMAAEKFDAERQNAFMEQRITFECSSKLNLFFSIKFLKAVKAGDEFKCYSLASRFEEEGNDLDLACEMYTDQIKNNRALTDALVKYADALNSLKKLMYFGN